MQLNIFIQLATAIKREAEKRERWEGRGWERRRGGSVREKYFPFRLLSLSSQKLREKMEEKENAERKEKEKTEREAKEETKRGKQRMYSAPSLIFLSFPTPFYYNLLSLCSSKIKPDWLFVNLFAFILSYTKNILCSFYKKLIPGCSFRKNWMKRWWKFLWHFSYLT